MRTTVRDLLATPEGESLSNIEVCGWVRTRRDSKTFSFLEVNDGSCLASLQAIADSEIPGHDAIGRMGTGASVRLRGDLIPSPGKGQRWELKATEVELLGPADETYPLQKKGHGPEFLREIAHLRPRTNLFGCVFRVRSEMSFAIHNFFRERGFLHVHTPIITASDCEGAGEMFRVTTLPVGGDANSSKEDREREDFFGKPTYLTVSGQLEAETFATALGRVYTFGPTFRAENSNTSRHASEFWMVEPEMAFTDLAGDMDLAEEFLQSLVRHALDHCGEDLSLFNRFVEKGLLERLERIASGSFARIPYREAVEILRSSGRKFDHPVEFGLNLQSEHERFLTEEHVGGPATVFDYPDAIKPFYMRANDDGETVAAMDVLVPGVGEIIGGSQREERPDILAQRMERHDLPAEEYHWYTDLRRYGTVPHAGFGLGFERLLMYTTGVQNIRDVIPFPRTPGSAEF